MSRRVYNLEKGTPQWEFYNSTAKIQIFGGGFANGKTTAAVTKAIELARDYPGSNGLIARATFPKLNDTIRKEFLSWIPDEWVKRRPTKDDNTAILKNGTSVNFRYIAQRGKSSEDGSTTSNLLSATFDWIVVDQIEDPEIEHKDFLDLMGRLRGNTPYRGNNPVMPLSGPRWLILTTNPTHNWVYSQLIEPLKHYEETGEITEEFLYDHEKQEPLIHLVEGSTYTNKRNVDKDFIRGLEISYKGQMRKRFLMGEWASFEGLVYPQFANASHVVPVDRMLDHLTYLHDVKRVQLEAIEAYDYGIASPSCYLFGLVDDLGIVHVIDGFYRAETSLDNQAELIHTIRAKYSHLVRRFNPILSDPAIRRRSSINNSGYGETVSGILATLDIHTRSAMNNVMAGITKVGMYLNGRDDVSNPYDRQVVIENADEELISSIPFIYFSNKLDFIKREFSNYFWKKNVYGNRIDQPIDKDDHAMDTLKYLLSYRPRPVDIEPPPTMTYLNRWRVIEEPTNSKAHRYG